MRKLAQRCAFGVALVAAAWATVAAPGREGWQAQERRIEARRQADLKACARLHGRAQEVCRLEAKGQAKVDLAWLAARRKPSPEAERTAKETKAQAEYAVARLRCEDQRKGRPRDECLARAKQGRDAAIRQAKIERVASSAELKARAQQKARGEAPPSESPAARFAAEKARCALQGTERDACLAEAKRRYGRA